jgi:hypothetical protein
MGNKSFNDLLQAIQSALVSAQDTLKKRREEAIRRMYEVDETGSSRSPVFTFAVPRTGTDNAGYEIFQLPASSFRTYQRPRISTLSLEFECELKEKNLFGASRAYTLVIKTSKRGWWRRKNRQRMRIVFDGTDQSTGEVRINGELLMEIPRYGGAAGSCPSMVTQKSIFQSLLDQLRSLWQSQQFDITEEQAKRAREILAQSDSGTPVRGVAETSNKAT